MEILSLYVVNVPNLQAEVENDDDDIVEEDEKDGGKTATSVCDTSSHFITDVGANGFYVALSVSRDMRWNEQWRSGWVGSNLKCLPRHLEE